MTNLGRQAVVEFIRRIFGCTSCREHFLLLANGSVEGLPSWPSVRRDGTRMSVTLWFWQAHNAVNARL